MISFDDYNDFMDFLYNATAEEFEEYEKAIDKSEAGLRKNKKYNDPSFGINYTEAIRNHCYAAEVGSTLSFLKAEITLNDLYIYYQYSKRYINRLEKVSYRAYQEKAEEAKYLQQLYSDDFYSYKDELLSKGALRSINLQAVILMLYSAFEKILKEIIEEIDDTALVLLYEKNDSTVNDYMGFSSLYLAV